MKCPICKSNGTVNTRTAQSYYSQENYTIKICNRCSIGYTVSNQKNNTNVKVYSDTYDYFTHEMTEKEKLWRINKTFSKVSSYLNINSKSKVLDIGCMHGYFLNFLKKKYDCDTIGIETENYFLKKKTKNIEIFIENIFQFASKNKNKNKFDLIIMSHSLEHFENPVKVISVLKKLLSENGKCLIIVPNYYSFLSRILKNHWGWLQPSVHFFHFSKKGLSRIFKKLNFKLDLIHKNGGDSLFFLLTIYNLINILIKFKKIKNNSQIKNMIIKIFSKVFKYLYYFGDDELVYLIEKK